MWVKICGIMTRDAALACAEYGADAVGFVFARSRRQLTPEAAQEICRIVPPWMEKIGVFVDAPWSLVDEIRRYAGLTGLQFHGKETPEYCARFVDMGVKVIKGFRVGSPEAGDCGVPGDYDVHGYLFESCVPGAAGGTGCAWDWGLVGRFREAYNLPRDRIILAGGLTPGNVIRAIEAAQPSGVDVSSGVESDGKKDPRKIREFIEKVRRWERGHSVQKGFAG